MKGKFKRWWSTIPSISTKQTTIVISDIKPREIMTCHLKIFSGNLIQNLYILYIYLHLIKITSLTCSPFWHVTVCQIWRNTTTVTCQWSYVYSLLTCHSDCQIWRNTTTVTVILRLLFIDMSQCARSEETPLQSHAWVILRLLKKPHRWCNG